MSESAHILLCRCAYARVYPAAKSGALGKVLQESGRAGEVVVVADLCELAAMKDERLKEWAKGRLTVLACHERCVRGLFAAGRAPLPETEVALHDVRKMTVGEVTQAVLGQAREVAEGTVFEESKPEWVAWFPVIDEKRCTNCRQCLSFCLFDVYGVNGPGVPVVQRPMNCKTDCPACARVCPEGAILFPKHPQGPINGDEAQAGQEIAKVDVSALLGGDVYARLRQRSKEGKRFSKERSEEVARVERYQCLAQYRQENSPPSSPPPSPPSSPPSPPSATTEGKQ